MNAKPLTRRRTRWMCACFGGLLGWSALTGQACAAVLGLLPGAQTAAPGAAVSVQLVIEGLGDFAPDSVGDFDIDIGYDPAALAFGGFALGSFLGEIGLGEAVDYSLGDLGGGRINLAELSLLEPDAAGCIFCVPPYLDAIQPGAFALATLDFVVTGLAPGAATRIGIAAVNALGDGFGIALPVDGTADALVRRPAARMPAPGALVLILSGLGALRLLRSGSPRRSAARGGGRGLKPPRRLGTAPVQRSEPMCSFVDRPGLSLQRCAPATAPAEGARRWPRMSRHRSSVERGKAAAAMLIPMVLTAQPIAAQTFSPVLEWSWTASAVQPTALNVMNTPSVIDLNQDGIPDVVFGATASSGGGLVEVGFLRALSGDDGSELFTVDETAPEDLRISTTCSIATGDIDLDGRPEIVACDTSGVRLIAFEHDGSFKWRTATLETTYWGAPSIADLDGDGRPEIVMGRQALDGDGNLLWSGTGGRGNQGSTGPLSLVADVDLDGSPEIIAGNTAYDVSGAIEWQAPLPDGFNAVGNFDDDAEAEIVLVAGGQVWLLEHDGDLKWGPSAIPAGGAGGPPTVADYDNDGAAEIGVAGASRYAVFETDGSLKWAAVTQNRSSNRTGSSVFDFEDDGAAEVVYSDETRLWIYRGSDGAVLFETPLSSCTWHEYPLVADVDGDDQAEILAVANNNCGYGPQRGVYVYGDAGERWVLTRQLWNQHTYHITNINPDGSIPAVEEHNWLVPGLNNFRLNTFGAFEGPPCDVDLNRAVDVADIRAIAAAKNTPAVPGDARDADGNGVIDLNDARRCVLQCSNPRCAP